MAQVSGWVRRSVRGGVGGAWSGGPKSVERAGDRDWLVGPRGFWRIAGPQLLPSRGLGRGNQL